MFDMFFTMQKWEKITNKSIHWEAFNIGSHPQIRHVRYTQLSFCHGRFCQCGRSKKYSRIHQLTDECCAPCMVGKGIQSKRGLNFGKQSKRGLNLRILSVKMYHAFVVNCLTVLLCFIHSHECFIKKHIFWHVNELQGSYRRELWILIQSRVRSM